MATLRGRFLARGSLSLAGARTHLEFVVDPDEAPRLATWLGDVEMPASWRLRRGRGVVTWKSADTVVTFLRRIGAGGALLELEARQVSRALRGELNRVLNAESANLHRAVSAAGRQLRAIDLLAADGGSPPSRHTVRLVADARREAPRRRSAAGGTAGAPPVGGPAGTRAARAARPPRRRGPGGEGRAATTRPSPRPLA
jgi:DNA-binding protein WhiA